MDRWTKNGVRARGPGRRRGAHRGLRPATKLSAGFIIILDVPSPHFGPSSVRVLVHRSIHRLVYWSIGPFIGSLHPPPPRLTRPPPTPTPPPPPYLVLVQSSISSLSSSHAEFLMTRSSSPHKTFYLVCFEPLHPANV